MKPSRIQIFLCILPLITSSEQDQIYFRGGIPQVKLGDRGVLSGTLKFSREGRPFVSFLGISYGKAERFEESQLSNESWEGIKESVKPGRMCPQISNGLQGIPLDIEEDCLTLNLHVPNSFTGESNYPVMVWIHGGGFIYGQAHGYGPKYFMDENIILIAVQYRLGVWGFLSTEDEISPGNYGLKDLVTALQWIQENVKYFGGDSRKVTIFGESAGGAAVHYLVLSPMAKGLFHRAISQSASALAGFAYEANPRANAVKLATSLNCPTESIDPDDITSDEIVTCLKGKNVDEISKASFEIRKGWPAKFLSVWFGPTSEPEPSPTSKRKQFLTKSPWSIVLDKSREDASSSLSDVPMIFGCTPHEGLHMFASLVLSSPELMQDLNTNYEDTSSNTFLIFKQLSNPQKIKVTIDKIKDFYFGGKEITGDNEDALINVYSDRYVTHSVIAAAVETARRATDDNPVFLYEYNYPSSFSMMALAVGATASEYPHKIGHADELGYQFNMEDMFPGMEPVKMTHSDEEFSKHFIRLWASFAKYGKPNYPWINGVRWDPISKDEVEGTKPLKMFRIESNPSIVDVPVQTKDRIAFWSQLWEDGILVDSETNISLKSTEEL